MDILNLGCGNKFVIPNEGDCIINHDRVKHRHEVDVVHDLNVMPWPWENNSFDMIVACAVLEHLHRTLFESMGECWRILRPEGLLRLKLPYWHHANSYADPSHYWHYDLTTLNFFDSTTKLGTQYKFYEGWHPWKLLKPPKLNPEGSSIIATLRAIKQ